jgi:myo-inositol-1-phosphate synthase
VFAAWGSIVGTVCRSTCGETASDILDISNGDRLDHEVEEMEEEGEEEEEEEEEGEGEVVVVVVVAVEVVVVVVEENDREGVERGLGVRLLLLAVEEAWRGGRPSFG